MFHLGLLLVEGFFRVSFRVSCRVLFKGVLSGFPNVHVGFFMASCGFHLGFHLGIL